MKRILEVCLIASLFAVVTFPAAAQSSPETPTLRPGIHVEMAATSTAKPVPDADQNDAFVLTVTDRGIVYEGMNAVAASALTQEIGNRMATRQQKLYVKADSRTPYASLSQVLKAAQTSGIESPILLTAQQGVAAAPGTPTPPEGVEVSLASNPQSDSAAVVELHNSGRTPTLKINHQETPWASLPAKLALLIQNPGQEVVVSADGETPFAQVVRVIDVGRSSGAKVVLVSE